MMTFDLLGADGGNVTGVATCVAADADLRTAFSVERMGVE
jgi:hypothetical protein